VAIIIPADVTIVTLRVGERELPQRWAVEHAVAVLRHASDLLRSRADIEFPLGTCRPALEAMPPGGAIDAVDEAGYDCLAAAHRAGDGVQVLLVDRVAPAEVGAQSGQHTRVCAIAYGPDVGATSRTLAHGLGHLLALPHVDTGRRAESGSPEQLAAWTRNLMYSGALSRSPVLTHTQVQAARSSPLARRFGGR